MTDDSPAGPTIAALSPNADWQIYQRQRFIYDRTLDWHTLEGPSVIARHGRYWMTYSSGAWTGEDYAVSWAVADGPLGPWCHPPHGTKPLLATSGELRGPGHNSLTTNQDGDDIIVFHSWDGTGKRRMLRLRTISFEPEGPRVDGPTWAPPSGTDGVNLGVKLEMLRRGQDSWSALTAMLNLGRTAGTDRCSAGGCMG